MTNIYLYLSLDNEHIFWYNLITESEHLFEHAKLACFLSLFSLQIRENSLLLCRRRGGGMEIIMKIRRKKRLVITNKKRFTLFLITLLILSCCGFSSIKSRTPENTYTDMISVSVNSGDTLWKLAASHNPTNKDIRSLVYKIKKLNNLSSDTIHSGDKILIPIC